MINLAIVGATGQVGREVINIVQEFQLPVGEFRLFASSRSAGQKIKFNDKKWVVEDIALQTVDSLSGIDIAIFSAGGSISQKWAPIFEQAGVIVIDNSSAWRKNPDIPLVVSEVNPDDLGTTLGNGRKIIANPNCTTMAAMPVLAPLHIKYNLKRLQIATYQAVSGGGVAGVDELATEIESSVQVGDIRDFALNDCSERITDNHKFAEPIAYNVVGYAGNLVPDGLLETDEEQKLRHESRKILHIPELKVSGTCVRVPVFSGHTLVVNAQFDADIELSDVIKLLQNSPGVTVLGEFSELSDGEIEQALTDENVPASRRGADIVGLPTPLKATGQNDSFVGRIRHDQSLDDPKKGLIMLICCDNLRKGAALNTVQITKILCDKLEAERK